MIGVAALAVALWATRAQAREAEKVQEYLRLAEETLKHPVTEHELTDAVLSDDGVATITALFKKSIAESLTIAGDLVTPELGGEATLAEGRLKLIEYPDVTHDVVRRLVGLKEDPAAMLDFLNASPEGKNVLKTTGGLDALLYRMTRSQDQVTPQERNLLEQVLFSAVSIHFKTWSVDPETQLEMIGKNVWRGRYVGFWHIHPPRVAGQDLSRGIEPSYTDMMNAVEKGQFVTIVFQPDGFDFYDLSPLGEAGEPHLSQARRISYRSPQWGPAFRDLIQERSKPPNASHSRRPHRSPTPARPLPSGPTPGFASG